MRGPVCLKRAAIAAIQRTPPRAIRGLRLPRLRAALLIRVNAVLQAYPVSFVGARTLFGFTLTGSTSDLLQRFVYVFGVWEPDISHWVRGHLRQGDVVVDVGANVGYFSLLSAQCVGERGRVLAFEPVPTIVAALRRNLDENAFQWVTVHPLIASDVPGAGEAFRSTADNLGKSATSPGAGLESEGSVPMVRVADVLDAELWPRVRLVKVDTEGDDLHVLKGLEPVLRAMPAHSAALVEITPEELAARDQSPEEVVAFMQAAGFDRMLEVHNSYAPAAYTKDAAALPRPLSDPPEAKADLIFLKSGRVP